MPRNPLLRLTSTEQEEPAEIPTYKNFPPSLSGQARQADGSLAAKVEVGLSRLIPGTNNQPRYFVGADWTTNPYYFSATVNGDTWTLNTSSWDTRLGSGEYTLEVRAYDAEGNFGTAKQTIRIDKTAPTVTLSEPTSQITSLTAIRGYANDNYQGSGVASLKVTLLREDSCATYQCSAYWNGAAWFSALGTVPPSLDLSWNGSEWRVTSPLPPADQLRQGDYTVRWTVRDKLGNTDSSKQVFYYGTPPAPVGKDDNYTTPYDQSLNVVSPGVLANDSNPARSEVQTQLVSNTSYGMVNLRRDGSFFWTPPKPVTGGQPISVPRYTQFTYRISDGVNEPGNTATVVLAITGGPSASSYQYSGTEDTPLPLPIKASGPAGYTITITKPPANGVLSGTAPDLTYTPARDFNGFDTFEYKVDDGRGYTSSGIGYISISPVNDAPTAQNLNVFTDEDKPLQLVLRGADVDSNNLTYGISVQPQHGKLAGTAPNLLYIPDPNYNGPDSFVYTISDGQLETKATVSIAVTPVNDAPFANSQRIRVGEDDPRAVILTGSDDDGDALTYTIISPPANGKLSGTAPNLTYIPNRDYNGPDSFVFKVSDGKTESSPANIFIDVAAVNDAPVAQAQNVTTDEDSPKAVTLQASDVEGDPLTYIVTRRPSYGTLSGTAPNLTYTPNEDFNGTDSFDFKASDGNRQSSEAKVAITVNPVSDAPIAYADSFDVTEDQTLNIPVDGVLANDLNPDGGTLSAVLTKNATHGQVSLRANGSFSYLPDADFVGSDSFEYMARANGLDSVPVKVTLSVQNANDAPIAAAQNVGTDEDTAKSITLSGSDIDGDTLTYSIVSAPTHGTLSGTAPNLTYTPGENYNGADSFVFKVSDGTLESQATVSISVKPINDAPRANASEVTTSEDTAVTISPAAADLDGDALTYTITKAPSHGTLSGTGPDFSYTPASNYNGTDSFSYKVNDGISDSAEATIAIAIRPVNDAPQASPQSVVTLEDTAKAITLSGSDIDGDALTYVIVTPPSNGALSGTAPNLTYMPAPNFNGSDSFTYKVSDGTVQSEAATVSITVTAVNDAPVATSATVSTPEDTAKSFVLSGTDADGDKLTYSVLTQPTKGTLSGTAPNLTYTPGANFNGSDSLTFKVSDGTVNSNGTISLTVTPVNDAPTANAQSVTTPQLIAKDITLTGNDVDGDALTYTIVTPPSKGTLSGNGANRTYTPSVGFSGTDSFTFKTSDGSLSSAPATVTITVTPLVGANVEISYVVTAQWPGGFTADVTIKNKGPAINGWTVAWTFPGDQRISNLWRGQVTQSGKNVTVKTFDYNKVIPTGGTETFGFQGSFSGTNAKPSSFTLNGLPVTVK